jgi:biopolymer transport protein TolR
MRRRAAITSLHQMKEINVVPMIDVMMFLLVVFIITMPLVENGITVNLPKGTSKAIDPKMEARQIAIRPDGLYLDNRLITKEQLALQVKKIAADDVAVIVRGDASLSYGRIMEVMKILNDAQITKMALATSPEGPALSPAPRRPR